MSFHEKSSEIRIFGRDRTWLSRCTDYRRKITQKDLCPRMRLRNFFGADPRKRLAKYIWAENTNLFGLIPADVAGFANFPQQLFVFGGPPTKPPDLGLTAASDYHPVLSMSAHKSQKSNKCRWMGTCKWFARGSQSGESSRNRILVKVGPNSLFFPIFKEQYRTTNPINQKFTVT